MYNKPTIERNNINNTERINLNNNKIRRNETKLILKDKTPFNPPLPKFDDISSKISFGIEDIIAHITTKRAMKKANKVENKNNDVREK